MTKQRMINTRFWDDSYTSNLKPIEKLLFLYCLTNTSTNISGIYEIPFKKIVSETGLSADVVTKILARMEYDNKIFFRNGWIGIKNFIKHQNQNSPQVKKGIEMELKNAPQEIQDLLNGKGMDTLSHLNLNLNLNPNLTLMQNSPEANLFDVFWKIYPKKVGKAATLKAWKKIKPSQQLAERIIQSVSEHLSDPQWKKENGQFIPHPATYLNQGRWDDEVIITSSFKVDKFY